MMGSRLWRLSTLELLRLPSVPEKLLLFASVLNFLGSRTFYSRR